MPDSYDYLDLLDLFAVSDDAFAKVDQMQTRLEFNEAVKPGSPGFIPRYV